MRKKVRIERANGELVCNVELYLEKKVCIEDMTVELELEVERKGIGSIKKKYLPSRVRDNLERLNDYGFNLSHWDCNNLNQEIVSMVNELNDEFFHRGIGWFKLNDRLVFRANHLVGSNIESKLSDDKFILKKRGCINDWVDGVNSLVANNKYMALIVTIGFTSVLTNLINIDNSIGSLFFNICGGISTERDIIVQLLNSIWGGHIIEDKGIYKIYNGNIKRLIESVDGNEGLSILVKDISKSGLVSLINSFQSLDINSSIIINSSNLITSELDKNVGLLARENITEIYLDICNLSNIKEHLNCMVKLIKLNYGLAGELFVEYLFEKGIEHIIKEFEIMKNNLALYLKEKGIDYTKVSKIAIVLLTAKYLEESIGIRINQGQLKDTMIELEGSMARDKQNFEIAMDNFMQYFYKNKSKFILKGEGVRKNTVGAYEINDDGEITKLIVLCEEFQKFINLSGYKRLSILRAWKNNNLLECEKGRYYKRVGIWTENPPCIVVKVKDGGLND